MSNLCKILSCAVTLPIIGCSAANECKPPAEPVRYAVQLVTTVESWSDNSPSPVVFACTEPKCLELFCRTDGEVRLTGTARALRPQSRLVFTLDLAHIKNPYESKHLSGSIVDADEKNGLIGEAVDFWSMSAPRLRVPSGTTAVAVITSVESAE
jgi:hypothetical protein